MRLLSFINPPTESFYVEKIARAFNQRVVSKVITEFTNCFRLVHGEGDGLPGLIVDIYNGIGVMQAHSIGVHKDRQAIAKAVKDVVNDVHSIYYKSQNTLPEKAENEYLLGMSVLPHVVLEHGNRFYIDWEEGQKTGFFS